VNFLRDSEGFACEGVDVVDLRGGSQGAEDVGALGGVRLSFMRNRYLRWLTISPVEPASTREAMLRDMCQVRN
jgi:hypothetical protein